MYTDYYGDAGAGPTITGALNAACDAAAVPRPLNADERGIGDTEGAK